MRLRSTTSSAPPAGASLRIEEASSLGDHAADWDALVTSSARPTPFLASWWVDHVDDHRRRVVLVFDGRDLIGGLACSVRRRAGLIVVGHLGASMAADHQDIVARAGAEDRVLDAVRSWLLARRRFLIRTDGTPVDSLLAQAVPGWSAAVVHTTAPYVPLTVGTVPRSSRVRNTVRRSRNRLARQGLEHRRIDRDRDGFERALADLVRLHRTRWPQGSNFERRLAEMLPALHRGAERGLVGIHELVVAGRVVASMVVMDLGDRRYFYQSGRETDHEWRGAGSVLMDEVVQDARERGMVEFDMLRGPEPYKLDWSDDQRPLVVLLGARGAAARAVMLGALAFQRAKPGLRQIRDRARRLAARVRTSR